VFANQTRQLLFIDLAGERIHAMELNGLRHVRESCTYDRMAERLCAAYAELRQL